MSLDEFNRESTAGGEQLSPVKRALLEIRALRERVTELEGAGREPVAIIGIGIRAPGGVVDLDSLAELLWNGTDAITRVPPGRWPLDAWFNEDADAPGKMYTREGGFIADVDQFDADFFGIAPVEAASMDPQQRLVLELAWEALEDAGHAPSSLAGSRAGVFLGIANNDYGRALFAHPELIDPYFSSGNAFSIASGRLSYLLGLHGPAVSIDTACSSSLVAVHLACQSLRAGECSLALAGGVNLILAPEINVNFCKAGMMSRDGRCKTFDAAADGYVRGEGGAIIVMRRLKDALADGDRVLAVIRGTAINQDGRSNGLTAPNGPAQEAVIRAALQAAGMAPAQIGYVETHGTGTSLGDPIEVNALGAVLSEGRAPGSKVVIGSIKTNVGHLEAAAGIVGLAKAVLALQRQAIPPHLHFRQPNPYIDWATLPLTVPVTARAWSAESGPRCAGVSSFGFSGTNAHIVLEEAPESRVAAIAQRAVHLLPLSARDTRALDALAARHVQALEGGKAQAEALADYCYTGGAGRAHFSHRVIVSADSAAGLAAGLSAFRRGETASGVVGGVTLPQPPRVAFLFPGQGPQYLDMGRALHAAEPAFRNAFDACVAAFEGLLPASLRDVVFGSDRERLDQTQFAQPAMFTVEVALAALWRSWGIEPVAVMGHSFGEYAAACVAGAVSLADAARMVAVRARLTQSLPPGGAMTVIEAAGDAVRAAIANSGRCDVVVAALNGSTNTVISGAREAVESIAAKFATAGARVKPLRVSHAFHSPLVEPVLDEFEREVSKIAFLPPQVPLVSSRTGRQADAGLLTRARYWREHMREPVRFADAMGTLGAMQITHFIEMSPHPVLLGMGAELVSGAQWLPSLREGQDAWSVLLDSVQQLYCAGAAVDWPALQGASRRRVRLPTYPFQRRRHWVDAVNSIDARPALDRWALLTGAMDRQSERGPLGLNAASYPDKWECLARLTSAHAIATLRDAGLFRSAGESHDVDSVLQSAGIAPTYRHLIARWLAGLAGRGILRAAGEVYVSVQPLPDPQLDSLWSEAEAKFTDNQQLLAYVRNCGQRVAAVLRGRESPLETLFPDGSFELARGLYERSSTMLYINALAGAAFESLAAAVPRGGLLRVLEIGAGTGGTTSSLLPLLSPERTRYLFTDVSDAFLDQARDRFAAFPFVEYGIFNLEGEIGAQGYAAGQFDLIVSANCVHAVKDLRAAMVRLVELLAPGGVLVLVESTVHLEYFDMTTGLIEGWQHFADDLRGDNPLLPPAVWVEALQQAGFVVARAWPGSGSVAEAMGQHVIIARAPGDAVAATQLASGSQDAGASTRHEAAASSQPLASVWLQQFKQAGTHDERLDLLRELVRQQVMRVLHLAADAAPSRNDRLMDLGMDSLMAVQLRNALTQALGCSLPSTLMFDHPTIDAMAAYLARRLPDSGVATSAAPAAAATAVDVAAIAAMSDAEIERLLDAQTGGEA